MWLSGAGASFFATWQDWKRGAYLVTRRKFRGTVLKLLQCTSFASEMVCFVKKHSSKRTGSKKGKSHNF